MERRSADWSLGGIDGAETEEWVSAGFEIPKSALIWREAGFRAAEATIWRQAGWPPDLSATLCHNGVQPGEAKGWKQLDWSTQWVVSATEKGLPLSVATHWSGAGFQPHQIVCLYHLFGDDVETARTWKDLSIGPLSNNSITEVVKAGLSRDEVDRWMAVGAGLGDIPQALRRGLTMEQVAAQA